MQQGDIPRRAGGSALDVGTRNPPACDAQYTMTNAQASIGLGATNQMDSTSSGVVDLDRVYKLQGKAVGRRECKEGREGQGD